jgi:hypothetical protein
MRCTFGILLSFAVLAFTAAQVSSRQDTSPAVSISLPADIPPETVQIRYFMSGTFGGYGTYIEPLQDLRSYRINAFVQGQAATAIKILVYAAGCEIMTFDLSLSQNPNPQEHFICAALPKVSLSGQLQSELIREHNTELVVSYMAYWQTTFSASRTAL